MDQHEMTSTTPTGPRPRRRAVLTGAGGVALTGAVGAAVPAGTAAAAPVSAGRPRHHGFARFEWLGTAGWRVTTPTTTVLVDPYLSRFETGLGAGRLDPETRLLVDTTAVDAALGVPGRPGAAVDAVLVTHTHWDHFADVPHIAATRGAMVYTTLTGYHLGQSMGLPSRRLAVVKGSEELVVGDLVVRVVSARHSRSESGGLLFPGVRTQLPPPPETITDLPEGDTLGFVLRRPGRRGGVLLLGASDYDDHELRGLDVDTVALPVPSNDVTADYVGRLLRALDRPRTVVLVHWDEFESPLHNPPATDDRTRTRMREITAQIRRVSPRSRVVQPAYLTPLSLL
ncbi:MBL fold metallo-hydrolase [Terrabacter sp. NPDC000476]|uniref:MBL fold metallo-hydrolase n=1 Tax=Terrabacter sp. NPDC000476 TaxID=3154258 RepID=UPI00331FB858